MTDTIATSALLTAVFPGAPTATAGYLKWLYEENPAGGVIEANVDDDLGRAAHYAVVPTRLSVDGTTLPAVLSLNTAVDDRMRGQGLFVNLAGEVIERSAAAGARVIVGVANANSTHGFVQRLGFDLVGPLPVTVLLPGLRRTARAPVVSAELPPGPRIDELLEASAGRGLAGRWDRELLTWRLARPGARYLVHDGGDWLAVTTAAKVGPLNAAMLLAVFAATPLDAAGERAVVRSACRSHRAAVAIHAGYNQNLRRKGVPLPDRLKPSPLNLIVRQLDDDLGGLAPVSRFEFLDFDAY